MKSNKKTLEQKQLLYPNINTSQALICMYLYGGEWYKNLSINDKINHRTNFINPKSI